MRIRMTKPRGRNRTAARKARTRLGVKEGRRGSPKCDNAVAIVLGTTRGGRLVHINEWERLAHDAQYSAADLARACEVSLRHLQRYFHDSYRLKLRSWLNEMRLWRGLLMLNAERSVKEVAYDLGFKQCSHFSREFKRYHGLSPSAIQMLRGWRRPVRPDPLVAVEPPHSANDCPRQLALF
jgi:AraC-like DNA-binding protein